jgi:hypothetical protein
MAEWNFIVTHYYDVGGSTGTQVITDDVISLPKFTDTGSGEVNEATILLDASNGSFISDDATGKRIIQQHDIIKLYVTDGLTAQGTQRAVYEKYFNVVKKIPVKSKSEGVRLQIELLGVENWLQRVNYIKPHYFENPAVVFEDICNLYNASKGTGMPTLTGFLITDSTNQLPQTVNNIYDFGNNEDNCFDRISDVIDKVGASGANGGVLDFFDFKSVHSNNGNTITTHVFSSGNDKNNTGNPGGTYPIITINNSTSVNVGESDGGINNEEGTLINSWGANDAGSLPIDFSQFYGRQEWWNLFFPQWLLNQKYYEGTKVSYVTGNTRYNYRVKSGQTHTSSISILPTNTTYWEVLTSALYYGNVYKYSPWTAQRKTEWINGAADPTSSYGLSSGNDTPAFFDHNIVCRDGNFTRTFVDQIATSPGAISEKLLYDDNRDGTGTALYRGLRVLCSGNPVSSGGTYFGYSASSASAAKDDNGRIIANSVMEYTGTKWLVKYRPYKDQFNGTTTPLKMQVVVLFEGRTYEFYSDGSNQTWQDYTDNDNGNDCLHPVVYDATWTGNSKIHNVPGVLADYTTPSSPIDVDTLYGWDSTNTDSAIEVIYNWSPFDIWDIDGKVLSGDLSNRNTKDYYQAGAWLSMRFPFPTTTATGTGTANGNLIGDWYGGGTNTDNPHEPTTIDIQNMHMSHDGKRGFNNGLSSEDFGQLSAISFMTKLWFLRKPLITGVFEDTSGDDGANFKMRCVLVDTDDNVVTQDFVIPFNNTWRSVTLPISGFEIYRGREPRYNSALVHDLFPPKGLDVQDIFIWRNLKMMSIFTLESYDGYGRYHPGGAPKWSDESILDVISGVVKLGYTEKELRLAIDSIHFVKPLLVNTGNVTGRVIDPDFIQRPDIPNYEQLKSDAHAEKQIKSFQHVEYDTTTTGRFDIGFGDYFKLYDEDIIPSNLEDSTNTIKLVAKRIEYSITKPLNGKGGFLRRIRGVRRFT